MIATMCANPPGGPFPFPGATRAWRPSPLHFRWHSSNVPGLGRHPQLPSSEAAAAPLAAAPGVRSEPRPVLDPVPRPPPSGGRVKPGGEGGGGGSPTRDGVGGGGGPAGGELAANTFPMVSARGKVRGQGSGRHAHPRMRPQALPTQSGLGSHWRPRRLLFPAWAPLLPRALSATEPAAAAATAVFPPHGFYWFGVLRDPPTALEERHSIGELAGSSTLLLKPYSYWFLVEISQCSFLYLPIGSCIPSSLVRDAAGLELVRYLSIAHALTRLPAHCPALLLEARRPAPENALTIGGPWLNSHSNWLQYV